MDLQKILAVLPPGDQERVLVGVETSDDAAVFLVNDETAVVQTVDFFTPIVNDPFMFGQITAANALSDIYAMGCIPSFALSLIAYPCQFGMDILGEIVRGGIEKMSEAGVVVIGGHSVEDEEPKYGFCVTGFAAPDEVIRNSTAQAGDLLYMTKVIGTGVIATAIKADMIDENAAYEQLKYALRLNRFAAEAARKADAHALTDVTGFGVVGHAYEMARGSGLSLELYAHEVKISELAVELASYGVMPAGLHENKKYVEGALEVPADLDRTLFDMLFDPQTSGGLLIAVPEEKAPVLEQELKSSGEEYSLIGRFFAGRPGDIVLR